MPHLYLTISLSLSLSGLCTVIFIFYSYYPNERKVTR
jgi:hypothetical protein